MERRKPRTHGALTPSLTNIRDGGWTFAHGPPDADVTTRTNADLKLLPAD
ncbi:hypothetical protein ACGFIE_00275 [Micromonospora sp. NPDC049275]